jgi:hypothetical protein
MQRWKFLTRWMVAIGLALSIGVSKSVFAQTMDIKLPVLSLTGSDPGYDPNIYLGGVIVVPEAAPGAATGTAGACLYPELLGAGKPPCLREGVADLQPGFQVQVRWAALGVRRGCRR